MWPWHNNDVSEALEGKLHMAPRLAPRALPPAAGAASRASFVPVGITVDLCGCLEVMTVTTVTDPDFQDTHTFKTG